MIREKKKEMTGPDPSLGEAEIEMGEETGQLTHDRPPFQSAHFSRFLRHRIPHFQSSGHFSESTWKRSSKEAKKLNFFFSSIKEVEYILL